MVANGIVIINRGFGEDGGIRLKSNGRSSTILITDSPQMTNGMSAVFEADKILPAIAIDVDFHPRGKSVNDRGADAVKTAANFIAAFSTELAASVKNRKDSFHTG